MQKRNISQGILQETLKVRGGHSDCSDYPGRKVIKAWKCGHSYLKISNLQSTDKQYISEFRSFFFYK
jgi:hypothetical protein